MARKNMVQEGLVFIRKREGFKTNYQAEKFVMNKFGGFLFEAVIAYFLELERNK